MSASVMFNPSTLFKRVKVIQKPQGKLYAPGISLQGNYLKNYGFNLGNRVLIEVSQDRIIITKLGE